MVVSSEPLSEFKRGQIEMLAVTGGAPFLAARVQLQGARPPVYGVFSIGRLISEVLRDTEPLAPRSPRPQFRDLSPLQV